MKNNGLHIDGVPDAVKFIKLSGRKARRLADLVLHRHDLEFSARCLVEINRFSKPSDGLVQQALWRSAVLHYIKCFGNSAARGQLSAKRILKNEQLGLEIHKYFKELRDKHIT